MVKLKLFKILTCPDRSVLLDTSSGGPSIVTSVPATSPSAGAACPPPPPLVTVGGNGVVTVVSQTASPPTCVSTGPPLGQGKLYRKATARLYPIFF